MRSTLLAATFVTMSFFLAAMNATPGEVPPDRYFLRILGSARELEVSSLDPSAKDEKDGFHGYKVLGKTTVKDPETVKALVAAFKKGVEESGGAAAKDFEPRHGVRFVLNKTTVDLLLCSRTKVYYNGLKGADFVIAKSPQAAFDRVLKAAGVELAKPAEK